MKLERKTADRVTMGDTLINDGGDWLNVVGIRRMDKWTVIFELETADGLACLWRRDLNETIRVLKPD